jgi:adenosylmethionine-8-amino-7-oxononanoate aminotransferase
MSNANYIWYPYTSLRNNFPPIHIEKAKNCTLYAADGKEYIDAISSWWVNIHGHANEVIANAIATQAKKLEHIIFAGFTHTPAIELSQKLIELLQKHFSKVFFSDDGSTSVEVAIKMALQYWVNLDIKHKTKLVAFENAYHGDTFGAMSAGARGPFNAAFHNYLFEVEHIPVPNVNTIETVKQQFEALAKEGNVAAFIFEPLVQGAGGMLMHEAGYLDELLSIAHQHQIICIADEVMTGFGRTGKNFAIEYLQNQPDIICLSKGITGGFLPLGVTLCSEKIVQAFDSSEKEKTFYHGHSYTANPLSCTAANASIGLLTEEACQQKIGFISQLHQSFGDTIKNHLSVKDVRQQGTILAIEFKTKEDSSYFNSIRDRLYEFYLSKGILLRPLGNVIYIMPPYCITEAELNKVYDVIKQSMEFISSKE